MATSGSTRVAIYESWLHLEFVWQQNSQSVGDNTTTIGWKMNLIAGNGSITKSDRAWKVVIDGVTYSGTNKVNISSNSTQTLASGTAVISHLDDGTKSFAYSFAQEFKLTLNNGNYMGSYSGAGSGTLDTIARASQPSLVTWPETTQNVGNFGVEFSIHMNRNASAFTHTVRYEYGSRSGTIATGVGTGTTWAVPLAFMNDIPNATSGSGRIYVDTYNGTTLIGTKYTGFTATVPASVKPTCSLTLEDTTGVDDIYGSPVQGLSKIKITVGTVPAYSSPIASYAISANGVSYSSATATTDVLKASGSSPITATVKDKRGRVGTASYTMNVQAYTPPTVGTLAVHRCDEDGTENDQGDYIRVSFSANVTSLGNKNTATYTLKYKKSEATSYTTQTLTAYANIYKVTNGSVIIAADGNSSYDAELTVTDRHNSATRSTSASTAFTLMNWGADGTSMAIGKVAEKPNSFEIGLDAYDKFGSHIGNGLGRLFSGYGSDTVDIDTTLEHLVITNQKVPTTGYWYVETVFIGSKSVTSTRRQTALPYVTGGASYSRYYADGVWSAWESSALAAWPVGSIYIAYNHTNPGTLFGGTWLRITNAFLWATTATGTIGQTGGSQTVTLTVDQLPAHSHGSVYSQHAEGTKSQAWYTTAGSSLAYGAVETGGGAAHNNMPPYIQVSVWRRIA